MNRYNRFTTGRVLMLSSAVAKKAAAKAASKCEKRLRFDPVPVYQVTLAEDTATPYITTLPGKYERILVVSSYPAEKQTRSCALYAVLDDANGTYFGANIGSIAGTSDSSASWYFDVTDGLCKFWMHRNTTSTTGAPMNAAGHETFLPAGAKIEKIRFGISSAVLQAGTTITVYAATEV